MMKSIFLIILSILWLNSYSQIKPIEYNFNTEINYNYRYIKDSTNKESVINVNMSLLMNDSLSLFISANVLKEDSILYSEIKTGAGSPAANFVGGILNINPTRYYIIKKENKITTLDPISGFGMRINSEFVKIEEEVNSQDWMIHTDTLTIMGITCQKATVRFGNRNWEAWFAADIPISDGPYKFCGLPGLIVSIKDDQDYFEFSLKSIRKHIKKAWMYIRPDLIITAMNSKEFIKARQNYQSSMYDIMVANVSHASFDDSAKQNARLKLKELIKRNNNWIERYL